MGNKIEFQLLGDVKDLEKKLEGTKKTFENLGKVSGIALAGLTASVISFVKSAGEQEQAINQLNQALLNQGTYTDIASKSLQEYASALQEVSLFGDETIIKAEAIVATLGFDIETTKALTKVTLDLAQAKGMDLASAAETVTRSIATEGDSIRGTVVRLDGLAGSHEKASSAIQGLTRAYGGQAEAATRGLGSIVVLKNALSDLAENIGTALAPTIEGVTKGIKSFVDQMKQSPEVASMTANVIILGIQITSLGVAVSLLSKGIFAWAAAMTALNAGVSTFVAYGLYTNIAILTKNVGLLYPAVILISTGLAAWSVGRLIGELQQVKDLFDYLEKLTPGGQQRSRDQASLDETNAAMQASMAQRGQTMEQLQNDAAQRLAIRQQELANETNIDTQETILQQNKLARKLEYQAQIAAMSLTDLANLQTKLQQENDLTKNFEEQKTKIVQDEMKKKSALREADKSSQLAALQFASEMVQAFGKESKAAFFILKALRIAEILVNSFAADMNIMAVWAWNPPVAASLIGTNHTLTALSIAGVIGSAIAGYAVGTPSVSRDQMAMVHKNEMIIPATFSEAIRSGDLSLSGKEKSKEGTSWGSQIFDFTGATFNGITDKLVEEIFTKASENISNRTLAFRGA